MQTLRRVLNLVKVQWLLLSVAILAMLVAGTIASVHIVRLPIDERHVAVDIAATRSMLVDTLASRTMAPVASLDFSTRLPFADEVQAVLSGIQRSCAEVGAAFGGVQVQPRQSSREQLDRVDMTVLLRGSYAKVKRVLADVIERYPSVTASHVAIRRTALTTDVEATVALALWRPTPAASGVELSSR